MLLSNEKVPIPNPKRLADVKITEQSPIMRDNLADLVAGNIVYDNAVNALYTYLTDEDFKTSGLDRLTHITWMEFFMNEIIKVDKKVKRDTFTGLARMTGGMSLLARMTDKAITLANETIANDPEKVGAYTFIVLYRKATLEAYSRSTANIAPFVLGADELAVLGIIETRMHEFNLAIATRLKIGKAGSANTKHRELSWSTFNSLNTLLLGCKYVAEFAHNKRADVVKLIQDEQAKGTSGADISNMLTAAYGTPQAHKFTHVGPEIILLNIHYHNWKLLFSSMAENFALFGYANKREFITQHILAAAASVCCTQMEIYLQAKKGAEYVFGQWKSDASWWVANEKDYGMVDMSEDNLINYIKANIKVVKNLRTQDNMMDAIAKLKRDAAGLKAFITQARAGAPANP